MLILIPKLASFVFMPEVEESEELPIYLPFGLPDDERWSVIFDCFILRVGSKKKLADSKGKFGL